MASFWILSKSVPELQMLQLRGRLEILLLRAFPGQSFDFFSFVDAEELLSRAHKEALPCAIFFDLGPEWNDGHLASEYHDLFLGLKKTDPGLALIVLTSSQPKGEAVMQWLSEGASSVMNRNLEASGDIGEGKGVVLLKELLTARCAP